MSRRSGTCLYGGPDGKGPRRSSTSGTFLIDCSGYRLHFGNCMDLTSIAARRQQRVSGLASRLTALGTCRVAIALLLGDSWDLWLRKISIISRKSASRYVGRAYDWRWLGSMPLRSTRRR